MNTKKIYGNTLLAFGLDDYFDNYPDCKEYKLLNKGFERLKNRFEKYFKHFNVSMDSVHRNIFYSYILGIYICEDNPNENVNTNFEMRYARFLHNCLYNLLPIEENTKRIRKKFNKKVNPSDMAYFLDLFSETSIVTTRLKHPLTSKEHELICNIQKEKVSSPEIMLTKLIDVFAK